MSQWRPNIFEYLDFRRYLHDCYHAGKENVQAFSYRYLARRAGFTSPSFIKLVMEGQRNLSPQGTEKVAYAFGLKGEETKFFKALVEFGQAESAEAKNAAFARLSSERRGRTARRIDYDMFEYLSHWYYPAIREMVARVDFREDTDWIASQLYPSVKTAQVHQALEVLHRLGLVEREASTGRLRRGDPSVSTGPEVGSLAAGNFHRQMMQRASESIEQFPSSERDISGLTLSVRRERVDELKERLRRFRAEVLDLCDREQDPDIIYQLSLQLFPLNRTDST